MRTAFAVVGLVVVVVVTMVGIIRLFARYGSHIVSAAKTADQACSKAIKYMA